MINAFNLKTWQDWLGFSLIVIVLMYFTFFAIKANMDLSFDRHVLFMDELIVHDGVDKMRTASSMEKFFDEALGGDVRYGRILYYVSYLTSYIPATIWGDQGAIISVRLTQYIILVTGYLLLCMFFIRTWLLRSILFGMLMTVPSTVYYATMPKPEPIQLLCYVLFFIGAYQRRFKWGWHFLFLGLALGAKVSGLFISVAFILFALAHSLKERAIKKDCRKFFIAITFFVVGFLVAQGSILKAIIKVNSADIVHFITKIKMEAGDPAKDISGNVIQWLNLITHEYVPLPMWVWLMLIVLVVVFLGIALKSVFDNKIDDDDVFKKRNLILAFGIFTTISFFQIILVVPRIWPFYLHLSAVGILVFIFLLIDYVNNSKITIGKLMSIILLGLFIGLFVFAIPQTTQAYIKQANRTKSQEHHIKEQEYVRINDVITSSFSALNARRWGVFYDPGLYMMKSTDQYTIQDFWNKFDQWRFLAHAIVYYKSNDPAEGDDSYYVELYDKFVCQSPLLLGKKECIYAPVDVDLDSVSVYFRVDLIKSLIDQQLIQLIRKGNDATFHYRPML